MITQVKTGLEINGAAIRAQISGSIAENAEKLGITRGHLHNIIKGNKQPSAQLLLRIQREFGLSADDLIKDLEKNR